MIVSKIWQTAIPAATEAARSLGFNVTTPRDPAPIAGIPRSDRSC